MLSPILCGKADVVDSKTTMTSAPFVSSGGRSRSVDDMLEGGGSNSGVGGTVSGQSAIVQLVFVYVDSCG